MADALRNNDDLAVAVKGILGAIPVVGPLAAEIIGATIPNQRIHRVEDTLRRLESQLGEQAEQTLRSAMASPEGLDLIEEAMIQAGRAITEDRRQYIASLLKNGFSDTERKHEIKKRLIETFDKINDVEVLLLYARALGPGESRRFWEENRETLSRPQTSLGSSSEDFEDAAVYDSYYLNLSTLGLIARNKNDKSRIGGNELAAQNFKITPFGRMMLAYLDMSVDVGRIY
ncbi:conserved protein of unknown function [Pseudodesulfovibrio profundus]|uniref:DUF4393 domain-containing protein n=1 Tax=Pseudodesulfovibrio profundus TaxID=57320 RepID=A0A2C8F7B4_9BACT|nr:hypothetical protein [Pseudodesulfovibrio profundus]SOB57922.1 conserved protein of unknown function [Pseudodesulfovibrio profundus]